ncbi:MAG: hypothetical protein CL920_36040 [Deltaproteobacteria bacterium]|nr:hypothetical protein [Deltaproteobacteria bacterium]MBU54139.1 hypothetical protein [Deltaproteobacteria bacterium]|tara:strand:+ start:1922 stop:3169 length:1248 start_codon:yes stop_codon:yes gene_type:complete
MSRQITSYALMALLFLTSTTLLTHGCSTTPTTNEQTQEKTVTESTKEATQQEPSQQEPNQQEPTQQEPTQDTEADAGMEAPQPDNTTTPDTTEVEKTPIPEPQKDAAPADVPASSEDYTQQGPLTLAANTQASPTLPTSTGCSGSKCKVFLNIDMPSAGNTTRKAPYPVIIFSNGFLLKAERYKTYAERLAKWGYVVVRWDTNQESAFSALAHNVLGKMLVAIVDWLDAENKKAGSALAGKLDMSKLMVAGHSRGGKISALAAQSDARIKAIFGIDPVDSAPPGQTNTHSAIKNMNKTSAPFATVGAGKSAGGFQPCAPAADNYEKFFNAATTKAWEIFLPEAGHMQFLDSQSGCFSCLACSSGSLQDKEVREITQVALIAWAESTLRGADISTYISGSWIQTLTQKGTATSRSK